MAPSGRLLQLCTVTSGGLACVPSLSRVWGAPALGHIFPRRPGGLRPGGVRAGLLHSCGALGTHRSPWSRQGLAQCPRRQALAPRVPCSEEQRRVLHTMPLACAGRGLSELLIPFQHNYNSSIMLGQPQGGHTRPVLPSCVLRGLAPLSLGPEAPGLQAECLPTKAGCCCSLGACLRKALAARDFTQQRPRPLCVQGSSGHNTPQKPAQQVGAGEGAPPGSAPQNILTLPPAHTAL